ARTYELSEAGGNSFLVCEAVKGQPLYKWAESRKPEAKEIVQAAISICEALEEAHKRDLIHGRLGAHTIKITADGKVKVLDLIATNPPPDNRKIIDLGIYYQSPE